MLGGGTSSGGIGGARLLGLVAKELPWDRGRGGSAFGFRREEERMFDGSEATGRCSEFRELPEVRGRPPWSKDGRGPNLTFGEPVYG